ncbi:hypothetical protein AAMO2058_000358000 [Amorphochlora amoebiformis]
MDHKRNAKAEKLVTEAEKKLSGWSLFSSKAQRTEEAAEMYQQAALQYKNAADWTASGDTYCKAGKLYQEAASFEASNCYVEAAKAYKKVSKPDAVKAYATAIELYIDRDRQSAAARIAKEVGQLLEKDGKLEDALGYYDKSAHYYLVSDQPTHSNNMLIKVADLCVQTTKPDYKRAIKIYEKCAEAALDNQMLRYSVKGYLFKAALCAIALETESEDLKNASEILDKYCDMDTHFDGSLEHKFLAELVPIVEEGNPDRFKKAVGKFNNKKRPDDWTVDILLKIKDSIKVEVKTDDIDIR